MSENIGSKHCYREFQHKVLIQETNDQNVSAKKKQLI